MKMENLQFLLKAKITILAQQVKQSTKKQKIIFGCVVGFLILLVLFFVFINPKFKELHSASIALERAKSGYNFILQNASKVSNNANFSIDTSLSVQKSAIMAAKESGIKGAVIKEIDESHATIEIEDAQQYIKITQMLRILENKYGVTVDEITLDKQGDGIVYLANLVLVRLDKDEDIND